MVDTGRVISPASGSHSPYRPAGGSVRGPRVRELWLHPDAAVATGRHGPLPVQCVRPLQQDERPQSAPHQAAEACGECHSGVGPAAPTSTPRPPTPGRERKALGKAEKQSVAGSSLSSTP